MDTTKTSTELAGHKSVQLKVTLSDRTETRTELLKEQRASYSKHSLQEPIHIRLDPLKLPSDPLIVVAGCPKYLLKIPLMGALLHVSCPADAS